MIRFYNGHPYENGVFTDNEVWVNGDKIVYVGPAQNDGTIFDRSINLNGNLLLPGLKNAHTHSAMTFLRSAADDLPLQDWLFKQVFPREAKLTPESTAAFLKVAFLEYLANGITACFDMYFHIDEIARISTEWGFRTVICESITANEDFDIIPFRDNKFNNYSPFVSYIPAFHAEYTGSMDLFRYIADYAQKHKKPVFCHNSETASEYSDCKTRYNMSPTQLFDSLGMFEYGGGGFHCVYFDDNDMDIFSRHGCWAVTNPCSNAKLASGIFPLGRMLEKNVNLAIGTDGPASNNALDMFREMYLANVLAKLSSKDASAGDPARILDAAVSGGALCMGLKNCDRIAPEKQADLIILDMNQPNMQPVHNYTKNIVYSANPSNVILTMIAGKILYEKGEFFLPESVDDIYKEADRYTREIVTEI